MARIAGVDLPRDKRVEYALTYIFGIGLPSSQKILQMTGINPDTRAKDLTDDDVAKLRDVLLWKVICVATFRWTSSDSLILAVIADVATVLVFLFADKTPKTMLALAKVRRNLFRARRKNNFNEE